MMKKRRMIFLTVALSMVLTFFLSSTLPVNSANAQSVVTVQEAFAGNGNGENGRFIADIEAPVEGSREISSVEELQKIGAAGGYSLDGDYHLTADIDLEGIAWEPIGTSSSRFTGTFDGQGHVISNLTITGTYNCVGLFGYVGGTYYNGQSGPYNYTTNFKNIGLENINIDVSSDSLIIKAGGIFGDNHRGYVTVSNCYVTGQMKAESMTAYVGGLAGYTTGYNPTGWMTIKDSYNGVDVYAKGISYNEDGTSVFPFPIVEAGFATAGGLVGWGEDVYAATNCHNIGDVTSDSTGASSAGGILGFGFTYELDQVNLCSNRGNVKAISEDKTSNTGQRTNFAYAGGIIGYDSSNERITTITSCYNEGDVSAELTTDNTEVEIFAGGIGGRLNNQTISDCYNKGTICANNSDNTSGYAAGISGRVSSKSNVRRSYNTGTISGAKTGAIAGLSITGSVIRSNYYLSGSATKGVAQGDGEEGAIVLTGEQMKLEDSFKGYNFSKIWGFKTNENDNMPILQECYPGFKYTPTGEVPGAGYDFLAEIEAPKEGSYPIGTVEKLLKIGKKNGLPLTWDYHLTANLDLTGISWEPINEFRGVFDGQGYVIHNLEIVGDYDRAGLFGEIKSDYENTHRPILKNIALEDVYINTVSKSYTTSYVGGLLGNNDRAIVSISNCYVTGEISNSAYTVQTGGLVGRNGGYGSDMFNISDCQNFSNVTSIGNGSAGGILAEAGYVETMNNCYNYGRISSTSTTDFCAAGGVIANLYNGNTINNCFNMGDVLASSTVVTSVDAGGVVAYTSTSAEGIALTNCYNTGDISATFNTTTASTSGEMYAGGIGGRAIGLNISDSFNTGNISAIHNWNTVGDTGGIAGVLKNGSIRRSYSTGNITASKYAGGIIGSNIGYGFTRNTYWNSDVDFIRNNAELQSSEKKGVGSGEDATTSKTAAQLNQEATFKGFDFDEIWGFQKEINTDYPILRVFNPYLDYNATTSSAKPQKSFIVKDFDLPNEGSKPIATREDLDNIRNDLAGSYHLVADIDLTGIDWVPIGDNSTKNNDSRFSGTFDGQGHVITGLEVAALNKGASTKYSGLFGYVSGTANIRNLGLEDVYISNSSWTPYAGGLFANSGNSTDIAIDNCYTTGEIISTNGGYIGGIAGYIYGTSSYLTNCFNSAKVAGSSNSSSKSICGGGIVGCLGCGKISGCFNIGEVSMSQTMSGSAVGGIGGSINNASEIVNSYNKGKIAISSETDGYAGGITGYVYGFKCTISTSYNMGEVYATTTGTATSIKVEAGGIAGKNVGNINNCFNGSNVTVGASSNNAYSGGIVGENYSTSVVSKCYSSGNITTGTNLGGIAGIVDASATVKESYWNNEATYTVGSNQLPQSTKKGIGSGTGSSVGLTIAQMRQQSYFEEFDFDDVWSITANENGGFPMLQSKKCLYTVSILSGSGGSTSSAIVVGSWAKGDTVSVEAPAAVSLYRFKEWTATGIEFDNKDNQETTFTMPAKNISVTATYEKIPNYTLTVNNGSGSGSVLEGNQVSISASVLNGKTFKEWTSSDENVQFEDKTSSSTTFIMPGNDVTVEAVYEDKLYEITVDGGTASAKTAKAGELVTIKANEPEGKSFKRWKSASSISFSDAYTAETTFTMPYGDTTIVAEFQDIVKEAQSVPSAPTLLNKTSTSVTLNIILGAEYRCNEGVWQDSPVFSGLIPNTYYRFDARMKETQTHKASSNSGNLYVKMDDENVSSTTDNTSSVTTVQPKTETVDYLSNTESVTTQKEKASTPVISKLSKSKKIKRNAKYTLFVKAKVNSGKLTYQWQKSTKKNRGFKNIAGTASKKRTYKVATKKRGTVYYRCIITNTDRKAIKITSETVSKTVTIKVR